MATMEVHFFSESLMRNVTFNAIIPVDKRSIDGNKARTKNEPMKSLYLLHGVYSDYTDWMNFTRVALWAQDMNIAVFMPSGENKFYCDNPDTSDNFGKFIGEELITFTRNTFNLSDKKEDTYIAGLSMGGYGALLTGLRYPDTFSYIGSFSGCLILDDPTIDEAGNKFFERGFQGEPIRKAEFYEQFMGSLDNLPPQNDIYVLAKKCKDAGNMPKIYQSCGTSDFLLIGNRRFSKYLESIGADFRYEEWEGAHEWNFWDRSLYNFLKSLPLEPITPARYSGYQFLKY